MSLKYSIYLTFRKKKKKKNLSAHCVQTTRVSEENNDTSFFHDSFREISTNIMALSTLTRMHIVGGSLNTVRSLL